MSTRMLERLPAAASVALLAFAALPAGAHAASLSSLFKPKPSATTTTTTTTTASGSTSSIVVTANPTAPTDQVTSADVPAPGACQELPTTKAFQRVDGDTSDYSLAPGGNFESGSAGWQFSNGARIVSGNEKLGVSSGSKALQMPLGSVATSPAFCIDENHPHFRFTYKVDNSVLTGFIAYVLYRDSTGRVTNLQLLSSKALALRPTTWEASPASPLASIVPLSPTNQSASVQLKILSLNPTQLVDDLATTIIGENLLVSSITKLGGAASNTVAKITGGLAALTGLPTNIGVTIDSVMVDPYRKR